MIPGNATTQTTTQMMTIYRQSSDLELWRRKMIERETPKLKSQSLNICWKVVW